MAAGIVTRAVTITPGVTINQRFWVDDTAAPTIFKPVHVLVDVNEVPLAVYNAGPQLKGVAFPVIPATDWVYNTGKGIAVAASQTDSVLQVSAGAAGDYLHSVLVIPATTAPGVVTIKDNTTAVVSYLGGGTTALLTIVPFLIPVGAVSANGAWKVTTGANVSVFAVGRFS